MSTKQVACAYSDSKHNNVHSRKQYSQFQMISSSSSDYLIRSKSDSKVDKQYLRHIRSLLDARLAMFLSIVVKALVNNGAQYSFYCFLATQPVKSNNTEFNNQTIQHKYS